MINHKLKGFIKKKEILRKVYLLPITIKSRQIFECFNLKKHIIQFISSYFHGQNIVARFQLNCCRSVNPIMKGSKIIVILHL